jgi:hypothetical protein
MSAAIAPKPLQIPSANRPIKNGFDELYSYVLNITWNITFVHAEYRVDASYLPAPQGGNKI